MSVNDNVKLAITQERTRVEEIMALQDRFGGIDGVDQILKSARDSGQSSEQTKLAIFDLVADQQDNQQQLAALRASACGDCSGDPRWFQAQPSIDG